MPTKEILNGTSCNGTIEYSGEICREHLLSSAKMCDNASSQSVRVFEDASVEASSLLAGFQIVGSDECIDAAVPFLCLYTFRGLCDINGMRQMPTSTECTALADGVCQREWDLAQQFNFNLPTCAQLPTVASSLSYCANSSQSNLAKNSTCMSIS